MIKDSNFPAEDGENFGKRFLRGAYLRTSGSQIEQNARRAVRSKLNLLERAGTERPGRVQGVQ